MVLFERKNRIYIIYRYTASKSFERRVGVNWQPLHKLARVQLKFEIAAGNMTLMYMGHTVNH